MKNKITFIGNGNMALSIAQGLKQKYEIEVVGRDLAKLEQFEASLGMQIDKHLLHGFNIQGKTVLLCVKPANLEEIAPQLKGKAKVIYSVLAGTAIEKIKTFLPADAVVRSMPNLAASVGKSMTTLTGDVSYKEEAQELLGAIGKTLWVGTQKELDIATALAGSGPAYLCLIAEALADGAVKQGMKRTDAMEVMRGLFEGFGTLIQESHPALLKDAVMSPGGTTAAGYAALEEANVRSGCIRAIEDAYQKALALSK
ncbi:MAG: pyrroline-5-carboxylate reductase [Thiovulaceae bacterium]|nr:pyrroline-5-carboxylate reductase [Sulfurimonadaceae bacterium]MDD3816874.1 pyrroline-5-carboxylate reductase [Sulfurimonadaceae bacterium]